MKSVYVSKYVHAVCVGQWVWKYEHTSFLQLQIQVDLSISYSAKNTINFWEYFNNNFHHVENKKYIYSSFGSFVRQNETFQEATFGFWDVLMAIFHTFCTPNP